MVQVYRHRRLDNNKVFYVGIGKNRKRPYSKDSRNKYWHNIVNKVGYTIEVIQYCETWRDACELEEFLINEYGRKDLGTGCLVNMTGGGDGNKGFTLTREHKDKLLKSRLGIAHTESTRLKMSATHLGKKMSESAIIKMSKNKSKKVVRLDLEGNIIDEFPSAKDASSILKIGHTCITKVCRGKRKTAGGFNFRYKNN